MKKIIKALFSVFSLVGLYYLITTSSTLIVAILKDDIVNYPDLAITIFIVADVLLLLFLYIIFRKKNFKDYIRLKRINFKIASWSLIAGLAMIHVNNVFVDILRFINPVFSQNFEYKNNTEASSASLFIVFLLVCIMAPIVEEVLMRGVLFRKLEEVKIKPRLIVLISGFAFGFMHGNIIQGVHAILIGLLCALVFLWTKTIWAPILMHFGNNFYIIMSGIIPEPNNIFMTVLSYILALVVLPLAIFKIHKLKS